MWKAFIQPRDSVRASVSPPQGVKSCLSEFKSVSLAS